MRYALRSILALACVWSAACKAYQMPTISMEPTILPGDYFFVVGSSKAPARKEIVVYRLNGQAYTKRVLGIPGDTISMRAGTLIVNGTTVVEPYARHDGEQSGTAPEFSWQRRFLTNPGDSLRYHPTLTDWGPIVVPAGKYFILGDYRAESADSRYTGFIDGVNIFARPTFIYFSRDRHSGTIRWNRVGRAIKGSA
jgi:signal peptidase I